MKIIGFVIGATVLGLLYLITVHSQGIYIYIYIYIYNAIIYTKTLYFLVLICFLHILNNFSFLYIQEIHCVYQNKRSQRFLIWRRSKTTNKSIFRWNGVCTQIFPTWPNINTCKLYQNHRPRNKKKSLKLSNIKIVTVISPVKVILDMKNWARNIFLIYRTTPIWTVILLIYTI